MGNMSGHSKWATIKRQKGATDTKRGLTFTKISNAITIAVKRGGGIVDPDQNFRLRLAIEAARGANMPKENIERAIKRAVGRGVGIVEEVIYEGFAKGGVSVIIEAATDNVQRTTSEIKSIFNKEGASFGQPGSVAYQFNNKGMIIIKKDGKSIDEIFNIAADSGGEDIEEVGNEIFIYTFPSEVSRVKDRLKESGLQITDVELVKEPIVTVPISDKDDRERVINFLHKLEDLDDVQKVYSNLE